MPELPEVETIRRALEGQLAGHRVLSVKVRQACVIAHPGAEAFAKGVTGQIIRGLGRRGKFLTMQFASGDHLALHLRMTGMPLVAPADLPEARHTHLIFDLSSGRQFRYVDMRRFGRFWFFRAGEADDLTGMDRLGPEPFDVTARYLKETLAHRAAAIKGMLLDQGVVAGIGNIYSDEILYMARIHPVEKCGALGDDDWERLAEAIRQVIAWGIEVNALAPQEYLDGHGYDFHNLPLLRAYGRSGQPCGRCGALMERVVVGGRGSCFCPNCQRRR